MRREGLVAATKGRKYKYIPTALLSMMPWALVLAAADMAGDWTLEAKKRRRKEMVGVWGVGLVAVLVLGRRRSELR